MESSEILQHIQEQIDMILEVRSENNIEVLGSLYKDIVKMRHELFGSWLCKENNIPYVGDTRIKDFIINNLDEGIKKRLFKKTKTYNNTKYSNKTPDLLINWENTVSMYDHLIDNLEIQMKKVSENSKSVATLPRAKDVVSAMEKMTIRMDKLIEKKAEAVQKMMEFKGLKDNLEREEKKITINYEDYKVSDVVLNDFMERLPENLLKISRSYVPYHDKVIFCHAPKSRDKHDVVLAFKSQLTNTAECMIEYTINKNRLMRFKKEVKQKDKEEVLDETEALLAFCNLYLLLSKITLDRNKIKKMLNTAKYNGRTLQAIIQSNFVLGLSNKRLLRMSLFLLPFVEGGDKLIKPTINRIDPYFIFWSRPEVGNKGKFQVITKSNNVLITMSGEDKKIKWVDVSIKRDQRLDYKLNTITSMMKLAISDLMNIGIKNYANIKLHEHLEVEMDKVHHRDNSIYLNVKLNKFTCTPDDNSKSLKLIQQVNYIDEYHRIKYIENPEYVDWKTLKYFDGNNERFISAPRFSNNTSMSYMNINDELVPDIKVSKIIERNTWRNILIGRDISVAECAYFSSPEFSIKIKGPLFSKYLYREITGSNIYGESRDHMENLINEVIAGRLKDNNMLDFERSARLNQNLVNRKVDLSEEFDVNKRVYKVENVFVQLDDSELDDLMKNTEAERPEYDVIPDMDISHFILRSRPLPLNSYEDGVCRMGSTLLALYMQSIMSIDDIMGRVSVTERNVIRRGIELMCMHANLFSYSQYLIALGEDVKAYTDELYTYVKDFFEEGRDRMRLEFAVLEKFIDMAKHEALLAGKKDKDMLEAFGFVGAKKLIPRKVRSVDIRAKRMNRMAKSSDDVINPEAIMKVSMAASTEGETSTYESDKNVLEEFENVRQKKLNKKQRMREKKKKELEPTKEEDNLQDVDLLDRLLAKVKPIQETDIVENMEEFSQGFSAIDIDLDAELGGLDDDVIDESILEVSAL